MNKTLGKCDRETLQIAMSLLIGCIIVGILIFLYLIPTGRFIDDVIIGGFLVILIWGFSGIVHSVIFGGQQ